MKIYLSPIHETELITLLPERAKLSLLHTLVPRPEDAEMILLVGSFGRDPHYLLDHPLYLAFPERCAVYTEDDNYLPLVPGVYCSAGVDESSNAGRVFSYSYASARGRYSNRFVTEMDFEKRFLFSFQGGSTSMLRKRMFNLAYQRPDVLIENTSSYYHWDLTQPDRTERQRIYAETLAASHFVLCPRGAGTGSIRFFEVMSAGIAPVLLADDYLLPPDVPWDSFLLRFKESEIARLPELLEPHLHEAAERGRLAREAWLQYFAPDKEFDAIVGLATRALQHGPPVEEAFRSRQKAIIVKEERRRMLRDLARNIALTILKVLRIKSPYQMYR